jgi:hypothetical protein
MSSLFRAAALSAAVVALLLMPVAANAAHGGHGGGGGGGSSHGPSASFSQPMHSGPMYSGAMHGPSGLNSTLHAPSGQVFHQQSIAPHHPLNSDMARRGEWRDFNHGSHDFHHDHFNQFGFWPGWWGSGWGWGGSPWWYGGYYGDYGYGSNYGYPVWGYTDYSDSVAPGGQMVYNQTPDAALASGESDFYGQALDAFHRGDYQVALRLASHAAVDNPRDANVHLLLSLSMVALHNYNGAAMEAHAVAAMGAKVDWPALIGFYNNNVDAFAGQIRDLEDFAVKNQKSIPAHFLVGFLYLSEGHKDAAQHQLLLALEAAPQDRIAADLLTQAGGRIPESVARRLREANTNPAGPIQGPGGPPAAPQPGVTR